MENKSNNDKTNLVVGIIVVACIIAGIVGVIQGNKSNNNSTENQQTNTTLEKNDEERLDALRKCTVMEAADIYTTGIGGNPNTAFEDAKATCDGWYSKWGQKDFYDAVYTDWEDRKNETIDGKDLSYYLSILGW